MELTNKTIVLTGGTSGVGRQLVEQLADHNHLIVLGRDNNKLTELSALWPAITTYQIDLAQASATYSLAQKLAQTHGRVDVLINNAALQFTPKFIDNTFDITTVEKEISTNFTSVCMLISGLLPALQAASQGRIVNINSALGLTPKASSAVYCATKGGLNLLSQSLRYQLEGSSVCVQQAFLPLVDTTMTTGRGKHKMSASLAATKIIEGITQRHSDFDIGATRLLRVLLATAPFLAKKLLKNT
uniref:SDR family oxidoreductase n=1 Tax=Thaumasiovibrio occultus TaxID=1891184 RepID=UPI000B34C104|nr:SDR family NAD(P)-dependent oxidoreductase [Thaumasiovibrio occultus]